VHFFVVLNMAKLKYASGETPILDEHSGYTFQPNHYGQSVFPVQRNDRYRRPAQSLRQRNLMQSVRAWREQSAATQTAWENFVTAFPQDCKNPDSGFLTAYQNFVKRNQYVSLKDGPDFSIMTNPSLVEIFNESGTYSLRLDSGHLFLDYSFPVGNEDLDIFIFIARGTSQSKQYQGTQARYMGSISNTGGKVPNYGVLYNHYTFYESSDFAPTGWHVMTRTEMAYLETQLGGNSIAGGKLKETGFSHWQSPNTGASNLSGYTARGSGVRRFVYQDLNQAARVWLYDLSSATYAWEQQLFYSSIASFLSVTSRWFGQQVYLAKDDSTDPGTMSGNDGQIYPTAKTGTLVYTALPSIESKYRDLSDIPIVTDQTTWQGLNSGARCFYGNDQANAFTGSDNSLDITQLYLDRFGVLPQAGQYCRFKAIPVAKSNGQFFPVVTQVLEVT